MRAIVATDAALHDASAQLPRMQQRSKSHARTIGIASAIWAASILLSRIMGLVREQIIGRTLRASREADLYFASSLPDFLNYLLAAGELGLHQVRADSRLLALEEESGAKQLVRAAQDEGADLLVGRLWTQPARRVGIRRYNAGAPHGGPNLQLVLSLAALRLCA